MKKIIAVVIFISVLLSGCGSDNIKLYNNPTSNKSATSISDEVKGVWIYYDELSMKNEKGKTEADFKKKIDTIFNNCKDIGFNTLFVQVRPFCDSFYKSKIFPYSSYLTGVQGKDPGYDPLYIMVKSAHAKGLKLQAWINPFRVSLSNNYNKLSDNNPAKKWIKSKDKTKNNYVVNVNGGLYFDPAASSVQKLVIDGIKEIAENYDVDGIHIDDYFYPATDKKVDEAEYKAYTQKGGTLLLPDWRRDNISAFVQGIYSAIKAVNKNLLFTISPAGNIANNLTMQYADVELWCSTGGYCDYIIPQIYFGFKLKEMPFKSTVDKWNSMIKVKSVKLVFGIAAYKVTDDEKSEWHDGSGILTKQLEYAKTKSHYAGCSFFSYGSLMRDESSKETQSLKMLLR